MLEIKKPQKVTHDGQMGYLLGDQSLQLINETYSNTEHHIRRAMAHGNSGLLIAIIAGSAVARSPEVGITGIFGLLATDAMSRQHIELATQSYTHLKEWFPREPSRNEIAPLELPPVKLIHEQEGSNTEVFIPSPVVGYMHGVFDTTDQNLARFRSNIRMRTLYAYMAATLSAIEVSIGILCVLPAIYFTRRAFTDLRTTRAALDSIRQIRGFEDVQKFAARLASEQHS